NHNKHSFLLILTVVLLADEEAGQTLDRLDAGQRRRGFPSAATEARSDRALRDSGWSAAGHDLCQLPKMRQSELPMCFWRWARIVVLDVHVGWEETGRACPRRQTGGDSEPH